MTTGDIEAFLDRELTAEHIPMFLCAIALQLSRLNDRQDKQWQWDLERDAEDQEAQAERDHRSEQLVGSQAEIQRALAAMFPQPSGRPVAVVQMPEPAGLADTSTSTETSPKQKESL